MKKRPVITIDGPAGAGKSTISRILAERLSFIYLDTGALYRAMAYRLNSEGWDGMEESLIKLCRRIKVEMRKVTGHLHVFADGEDVTQRIRTEEIGLLASRVSAAPAVREVLLSVQRAMAVEGGLVASARERASRRYLELTERDAVCLQEIEDDLLRRDSQDRNRPIAPLIIPPDAVIIDSTDKTISQVVGIMLSAIENSGHLPACKK